MIQLPNFKVVSLNYDLQVDDDTPPLLLSVDAPQPESGQVLFRSGRSWPTTYADGKVSVTLSLEDLRGLGNGSHAFEIRLIMANGHVLTQATGHLSVYLL